MTEMGCQAAASRPNGTGQASALRALQPRRPDAASCSPSASRAEPTCLLLAMPAGNAGGLPHCKGSLPCSLGSCSVRPGVTEPPFP